MILCEHGPGGMPALFDGAREVIVARRAAEVQPALLRADAARRAGGWLAGYVAYEAGYALEPKLAPLMPARRSGPLVALGSLPRGTRHRSVAAASRWWRWGSMMRRATRALR